MIMMERQNRLAAAHHLFPFSTNDEKKTLISPPFFSTLNQR
jgi:hypothetical protein